MKDTSREAEALQLRILRELTGVDRLRLAMEMCLMARELSATRLRCEHPEWSDSEVRRELLRYAFESQPLPPPLL